MRPMLIEQCRKGATCQEKEIGKLGKIKFCVISSGYIGATARIKKKAQENIFSIYFKTTL